MRDDEVGHDHHRQHEPRDEVDPRPVIGHLDGHVHDEVPVVDHEQLEERHERGAEVVEVVEKKPKTIKRKKSSKKKPKPKVAVVGANLNVKINGAQVTQLELKCPSKRYRARVNGKMGNFTDLPNESCELFFKPTPAKFGPFTPNGTINCNITGGGAAVNCK